MIQRVEAGRELSHGAVTDLSATLSEQIGRGVTAVHMNTSRVVEFDSQALESLIEFDELAKTRGLRFVVANPSELLSVALSITGLEDRLEIHREAPLADEPEAEALVVEAPKPGEPVADLSADADLSVDAVIPDVDLSLGSEPGGAR